jgi:hypothetical protein
VCRGFGSDVVRIYSIGPTADDCFVDAVLDIRRTVLATPEARGVGLVVDEKQLRGPIAREPVVTQDTMFRVSQPRRYLAQNRALGSS